MLSDSVAAVSAVRGARIARREQILVAEMPEVPVSFVQVGTTGPASWLAETFLMGGPLRRAGSWCGCAIVFAIAAYVLYKLKAFCCSEQSCWYTWSCCRRLRMWCGLDTFHDFQLKVTVHRARDVPNKGLFVVLVPRRRGRARSKPKLSKSDDFVRTGVTTSEEGLPPVWEEELMCEIAQGHPELQVVLCTPGGVISRGASVLGWATLQAESLRNQGKKEKVWVNLLSDRRTPIGSIQISYNVHLGSTERTHSYGATQKSGGSLYGKGDTDNEVSMDDGDITCSEGEGEEVDIHKINEALTGPLRLTNSYGDYELRHFKVKSLKKKKKPGDRGRDAWGWVWYQERNPPSGTKPLGFVPFLAVRSITPIPKSIAEFVVKYLDADGYARTLMLQRVDLPRDKWVRALDEMVQYVRQRRRASRAEGPRASVKSGDASRRSGSASRSSDSGRSARSRSRSASRDRS